MAHQLQHRQKHADKLRLVDRRLKEGRERSPAAAAQLLVDPLHVNVDWRFVVTDALRASHRVLGLQHATERTY